MPVAKQRGRGRCERRSDVIVRARKAERRGGNKLAGGENVSGDSLGHLKMVPPVRVEIRARVISKRARALVAKKIFAADLAAL